MYRTWNLSHYHKYDVGLEVESHASFLYIPGPHMYLNHYGAIYYSKPYTDSNTNPPKTLNIQMEADGKGCDFPEAYLSLVAIVYLLCLVPHFSILVWAWLS